MQSYFYSQFVYDLYDLSKSYESNIFTKYFDVKNDYGYMINDLKLQIGEEKLKLYDSFHTQHFVKKIQYDIQDDPELKELKFKSSFTFTDKSLYHNYDRLFFKIINKDKGNHGFFYKENKLNFDILDFYPKESCKPGGLYSCDFKDVLQFKHYIGGDHLLPVVIPYDIPVYSEGIKKKSPVLYALSSIPLNSPDMDYISIQYGFYHNQSKWFINTYIYSHEYERNQKMVLIFKDYLESFPKKNYYQDLYIDSSIFYWNIVKMMIHDKKFKTLYSRIISPVVNNCLKLSSLNSSHFKKFNVSQLFYIFYKNKDESLLLFLKEYLFPKLIKENEDNHIRFNYDFDLEKIGDKLQKIIKLPIFFEFLQIFNGIISGSLLLEILMISDKNTLKSNDIDIYFSHLQLYSVLTYLQKNTILYKSSTCKSTRKSYHMEGVQYMLTINDKNFCDKPVQLIFVNRDDPCQFIFDNFDFDSCMNCYSFKYNILKFGSSIFQLHQMTISDKYLHKIFVDKDNYSIYRAAKTIDRSIKYIQRGFKITNLDAFLNDILSNLFTKS